MQAKSRQRRSALRAVDDGGDAKASDCPKDSTSGRALMRPVARMRCDEEIPEITEITELQTFVGCKKKILGLDAGAEALSALQSKVRCYASRKS